MKKIIFKDDVCVDCEVADTPEKQALGLMFRKELPENKGMFFEYGEPGNHSIWMKNTHIPLCIVFVDSGHEIKHIGRGEPFCEESIKSKDPVQYIIELPDGFCDKHGIGVGDKIKVDGGKSNQKIKLKRIANTLEHYGLYREASMVDDVVNIYF